jgi:hypothetical protein
MVAVVAAGAETEGKDAARYVDVVLRGLRPGEP